MSNRFLRAFNESLEEEAKLESDVRNAPTYEVYIRWMIALRDQKMITVYNLNAYLASHQIVNNDDLKNLQRQLSSRRNSEGDSN
jgi:hypothetical protein